MEIGDGRYFLHSGCYRAPCLGLSQGSQSNHRCVAKRVDRAIGAGVYVEFENGRNEVFDQVALTIAAPYAARICLQLSEDERSCLMGIQYQGIICASLLWRQPLANFYVTNINDSWVPFTSVIEMSGLVDRKYFAGNTVVSLPKYVTPDDPAFSISDQEVEKTFVKALMRMYAYLSPSDLLCFRVSRVRYVLAISTLN